MSKLPAHIERALAQKKILTHRSERVTIRIGKNGKQYKVLKIMFSKDGSIYVECPYIKETKGIISAATIENGRISLQNEGMVTSHVVKLSHHESGLSVFSKDGKVFSKIRKESTPLSSLDGHFATIKLQGLTGFKFTEQETTVSAMSSKDQVLTFNLGDDLDEDGAFALYLYHKTRRSLTYTAGPNGFTGPKITLTNMSEKKDFPAILTAAPEDFHGAANRMLVVAFEQIPLLNPDEGPSFTMIGGFDPVGTEHTDENPPKLLAMIYPASDFDTLKDTIGCIDIAADPIDIN